MPSVVYQRPDGRWHARPRGKHLGYYPTEELARAAVAAAAPLPASTVAEWARAYPALFPGRRNGETAAHNAQMTAPFVRAHGHLSLAAVDVLTAQAWAVRHPGHVRYLRLMFDKAQRAGLVSENVWKRVEVSGSLAAPRVPPSPVELVRLEVAARASGRDCFADLIVFTAYSGLRLSEVADVQAQDVLGPGRVVVRGKRRPGEAAARERLVAVFGPGRAALARQVPEVGLVFRSASGRPLTKHTVGRAFREVREEAGYTGSFHALRHHLATWLLDRGASVQDVGLQLGHVDDAGHVDTTQVRRVYGHPSAEAALLRLEVLAG